MLSMEEFQERLDTRKPRKVSVCASVPQPIFEELTWLSEQTGHTRSHVLNELLKVLIENPNSFGFGTNGSANRDAKRLYTAIREPLGKRSVGVCDTYCLDRDVSEAFDDFCDRRAISRQIVRVWVIRKAYEQFKSETEAEAE